MLEIEGSTWDESGRIENRLDQSLECSYNLWKLQNKFLAFRMLRNREGVKILDFLGDMSSVHYQGGGRPPPNPLKILSIKYL